MDTIEIIHAITEPTRFRLLQLLFEHHYCVRALSKKLEITESAVSQHMRILKKYQVVYGVKIGYQVHYRVDRHRISSLLEGALHGILQCPSETEITRDCSCEFISECIRRDSKILEEQEHGK
ncbi:metalloregulator ArsR/SmtB family transcription factor [Tissierella praeacuta]|uniref:ArsR/SmtB family transcription factor n=1 Tax=Tissierella praeacuta TaxID=43131 RepID=UPI003515BF66